MVAENLHLRFLPRSLLLNISRNNSTNQSNPRPDDYEKKRKRDSKPRPGEEEQNEKRKKKKKKRNDKECCKVSVELEGVIAEFLRRRGFANTLSIFLSEAQTEVSVKSHKLKLEDIYHCYCHQMCKSPMKENMEEGQINRENSFGKRDTDLQLNGENIKRKDKRKSRKNNDACATKLCMKTSNGSTEVKRCGSEEGLHRNEKSKTFGAEAVDYCSGHAEKKRTETGKRNEESVKIQLTSNEFEKVLDHADPLYKSLKPEVEMKKKQSSDEMKLIDNDEKNGFKKSKKKKRRNADLVPDPVNLENIEVFKKENRKKGKLDEISKGLVYINEKKEMAICNQMATGSITANKELNIESAEDPSEYLCKCLNSEKLKEEISPEMTLGGNNVQNNEKRNKKEKKALKKLQPTFAHPTNGRAKGTEKNLSEDIQNTQNITQAYTAFKTYRYSIGESVTLNEGSADNISHSNDTPVKKDGAKGTPEHSSTVLKKYKQSKSCIPTETNAFWRVRTKEANFVDIRLGDNS